MANAARVVALRSFPSSLAFWITLAADLAGAAEPGGALSGAVRDATGAPLPQLVLVLRGPAGERVLATGPQGRYRAAGLAPGRYALVAQAPGFVLGPTTEATVADREVTVDLTLAPAPVRERVVVTATRGEALQSTVGVATTVLDQDRIAAREASSLLHLLQEVPGVAAARAGGVGLQGSTFVRGGESNFARVLVDGVPVNEPGGDHNFGPHLPLELERVEVVRGAASSLYGTDALAGVIHLVTRRGGSAPRVHAEAEAGGFAWRRGQAGAAGRAGGLDWNVGGLRLATDNEEPNSAFRQTAAALAAGLTGQAGQLRLVLRGERTRHGAPGQTAYGRPDLDARFERDFAVAGLRLRRARGAVAHELRAGWALQDWVATNPLDSGPFVPRSGDRVAPFTVHDFVDPAGFQNDTARASAGYQVEATLGGRHLAAAGIDLEHETGALGLRSEPLLRPSRTNFGGWAQDRVLVGRRLFLTLGGRIERNDSFGTQAVPRAALAFRLRSGAAPTTLRASAGGGIKEPTFFESFGVSFFALGNPALRPEKSRTADAGIEQRLFGDRLHLEATAFHHDYRDQIAFQILDPQAFRGSFVNLGRTRARGLELALEAAPRPGLRIAGQYTFLDGDVIVSGDAFNQVYAAGRPLLRRPRHQGALTADLDGRRAGLGLTVVAVGRRADSDFAGLGLTENAGYARVDARARLRLGAGLALAVIAENLLDRRYEEVLGYPALGRSVRAALRWTRNGNRP